MTNTLLDTILSSFFSWVSTAGEMNGLTICYKSASNTTEVNSTHQSLPYDIQPNGYPVVPTDALAGLSGPPFRKAPPPPFGQKDAIYDLTQSGIVISRLTMGYCILSFSKTRDFLLKYGHFSCSNQYREWIRKTAEKIFNALLCFIATLIFSHNCNLCVSTLKRLSAHIVLYL